MKSIRRMSVTRAAGLAGCVLACVALGACGSSQPTAAGGLAATSPSATAPAAAGSATATASASPTSTSTASGTTTKPSPSASPTPKKTVTTTSGLDAARAQWKKGATASSATEGAYWDKAAADLTAGQATDPGDTSFYPSAVKDLKQLISLPDAQQTATQNAEFTSDVKTLDTFFQTPGLYQ
jgi:hypothetical protein